MAAAIIFFMSFNALLGPGWLGAWIFGDGPPVSGGNVNPADTDPVGVVIDLSEPKYTSQ